MSNTPQVSVVIPTYNRAVMLRAALESVLVQTVPALEVVVVDDGSTDATSLVIEALQCNGAPIVYIREPHANRRGWARNRGAGASKGDLIAFLDSDDLWEPNKIERQINCFNEYDEINFAFCNVQRFDENGLVGGLCHAPQADYTGDVLGELLEEPLAVSSALIVRREAFSFVGGFANLRMNEDYELTLRLAERYKAGYAPEALTLMREHSKRISRSDSETPLLDYISIVEQFMEERPTLPAQTRAHGKRGLANVHLKLALLYLERGNRAEARKHLHALMKKRPWDRRALPAYLRSWSTAKNSE